MLAYMSAEPSPKWIKRFRCRSEHFAIYAKYITAICSLKWSSVAVPHVVSGFIDYFAGACITNSIIGVSNLVGLGALRDFAMSYPQNWSYSITRNRYNLDEMGTFLLFLSAREYVGLSRLTPNMTIRFKRLRDYAVIWETNITWAGGPDNIIIHRRNSSAHRWKLTFIQLRWWRMATPSIKPSLRLYIYMKLHASMAA